MLDWFLLSLTVTLRFRLPPATMSRDLRHKGSASTIVQPKQEEDSAFVTVETPPGAGCIRLHPLSVKLVSVHFEAAERQSPGHETLEEVKPE